MDLEGLRRRHIESSGLGEALLPPVRVGECEVSLHRQIGADPVWALMGQDYQDDSPVKWYLLSFPDEADDDQQGEPSEQVFSSPRGVVPEALREVWGDHPATPPSPAIGDIWAVTVCAERSVDQGGPVGAGVGFTSGENGVAMYGVLPPSAASIEATAGDEAIPVHVGHGLFLAAIPPGVDITVIFRGAPGQVLEEQRLDGDWLSYS